MSSTPSELIETLPKILQSTVDLYWQNWSRACETAGIDTGITVPLQRVGRVWACSEFIARLCTRKPHLLYDLFDQGLEQDSTLADYTSRIQQAINGADDNEQALMSALRQQRQKEMMRIAWRDLEDIASLERVLHELSDFAEAMVSVTLNHLYSKLVETLGTPMSEQGLPQKMLVLGMGKLGGRELNFSSDIDLIFAYADEGDTEGGRRLTNHEFFLRLARQLVKVLNETTQDGFVFRVDTRLRPYGDSGPLVIGFNAIEQYYQTQGRDWERYAMIKARALAGDEEDIRYLESLLRPFIYRRYLDYSAFESIRGMKAMITAEVQRKGIKDNVKLGRGGIREIEFIGQTFQLLRGGRDVELQTRGIMDVLDLLRKMKLLETDEVVQLKQGYHFLRRLENRIQMDRDMQAHDLPVDESARARLSLAMGFESWEALAGQIEKHRDAVHRIFSDIVSHEDETAEKTAEEFIELKAWWVRGGDSEALLHWFEHQAYPEADSLVQKLDVFRHGARIRHLSEEASQRVLKLLAQFLAQILEYPRPVVLLERSLEILNAIVGRQVYVNLLLEYPQAARQMLSLCAISSWFVKQLVANPILLDGLLDANELYQSKNRQALSQELDYLLSSVAADDLEQIMDRLRQFKNAQVMKEAVLDVSQILEVTDVGDTLSNIAEVVLDKVLQQAWADMCKKYGAPCCMIDGEIHQPGMAIVAYGKLGGWELGYGSDLDIVFLHDSAGEKQYTNGEKSIDNSVFFSRVAQRVLHVLGTTTHSGMLYETDIRLRPEGKSGLMVSSLNGFEQYQQEKAWTWEHQALIRARIVTGNDHVKQEFDRIRRSVLTVQREKAKLCQDVVEMREKMRSHLSTGDVENFDLKQDEGGIVDIEFITQAGVLLNAEAHPDLLDTTSTLVYLEGLIECGWLDKQASEDLAAAYRSFRQQVNRQALMVEQSGLSATDIEAHRKRVSEIWKRLMSAYMAS